MIHAVIVDDELNSTEVMEMLLNMHCPDVKIDALCNNGADGIEAINKFKPDVVFLDIEMPMMNGFEMLEHFDELNFNVVFCTAYDKFAIKAFKYSALNYLLKPVDPEDLKETIKRIEQRQSIPTSKQIEQLLTTMRSANQGTQRVALSSSDGLVFVDAKDIMYCVGDSNYTNVMLANGEKILVSKTLKEIDDSLSGKDFYRIHKSFFINLNYINKFIRSDGGYVVMKDGMQITISRSKREEFFEMFSKF